MEMLKRWLTGIIALLFLVGSATAVWSLEPFPVNRYVTDQAGLLPVGESRQLAQQLDQYARDTGNQLLVITLPTLENREIVEFTEALFKLNHPGQKEKDNGVILLVAKAEHKIRIEVGYGLEGVLPDGKVGMIIRQEIAPRFKTGDFNGGIVAGIGAMITAITPGYRLDNLPETQPVRRSRRGMSPLAVLVFIIITMLSGFLNRINRNNYRRRFRSGYSEPWYWGGGSSFDSYSSGDRGGGGFDGGGGDFGGGGASGDW